MLSRCSKLLRLNFISPPAQRRRRITVILAMLAAGFVIVHLIRRQHASVTWKRVATIESFDQEGFGGRTASEDVPWNRNVVTFLDNHRFAVADGDHPVRIFDTEDGKLLTSFGEPEKNWGFRHFVLSNDRRLIILLPDAEPAIYDTQTGKLICRLPAYQNKYANAAFLADGHSLATYRGFMSRGEETDNLQLWQINEAAGTASLVKSVYGIRDASGLEIIGPYLVLHGCDRSQVFDANTLASVLQPSGDIYEDFLYLDPPSPNGKAVYVSLVRSDTGWNGWLTHPLYFRMRSLLDGHELRRWPCTMELGCGWGPTTMSPRHTVLAITLRGRVNFFRFPGGQPIGSVAGNDDGYTPEISFYDEDHVFASQLGMPRPVRIFGQLLTHPEMDQAIHLIHISSGREIAAIPTPDCPLVISPDGQRVLTRGELSRGGRYLGATLQPVKLWRKE